MLSQQLYVWFALVRAKGIKNRLFHTIVGMINIDFYTTKEKKGKNKI